MEGANIGQSAPKKPEPTVLVKKADGTLQRVPISQLAAKQTQRQPQKTAPAPATSRPAPAKSESRLQPTPPAPPPAQAKPAPSSPPPPAPPTPKPRPAPPPAPPALAKQKPVQLTKAEPLQRKKRRTLRHAPPSPTSSLAPEPRPDSLKSRPVLPAPPAFAKKKPAPKPQLDIAPQEMQTGVQMAQLTEYKKPASIEKASAIEKKVNGPARNITVEEKKPAPAKKTPPKPSNVSSDTVQWGKDDHKSLLDDSFEEIQDAHVSAGGRHDQVDKIISTVPGDVSEDVKRKLKPLVLSFLKDVRTQEQMHEYLVGKGEGGLGLDARTAATIIAHVAMHKDEAPPVSAPDKQSEPTILAEKKLQFSAGHPRTPNRVEKPTRQSLGTKSPMHDVVTAPASGSVVRPTGPVGELAQFDLASLRRLGKTPQEQFAQVKERFDTLQKESYLQFMKGKKAWMTSPLFRMYQQLAITSLQRGTPVSTLLASQSDGLTPKELHALVMFNKQI
jgi:hypothetical protein